MPALIGRVKKKVAEARKQTHEHVFHKLTVTGRRAAADRRSAPAALPSPKDVTERAHRATFFKRLSRDPAGGAAHPVRPLHAGRRGVQGRRRRQRRDALLRRALPGGPRRSPVPPGQGGAPLGARAFTPAARGGAQRPARRGRAAADAVGERHLPRLVARARRPRLLCPPAAGHEDRARGRDPDPAGDAGLCHALRPGAGPGARQGRRRGDDRRAISASSDEFDEAIGDYAVAYADQVERDYATFVAAVRNGRLKSDLSPSRPTGDHAQIKAMAQGIHPEPARLASPEPSPAPIHNYCQYLGAGGR